MAICRNYYGGTYYCNGYSRWGNWGRWVLLGVILAVALLVALLFACITARRRRRAGRKPFYGTGWTAGKPPPMQQQQPGYNNAYGGQQQYGANPYGGTQQTYGQNAEYYGGGAAPAGQYAPPSYPPPAQTRN